MSTEKLPYIPPRYYFSRHHDSTWQIHHPAGSPWWKGKHTDHQCLLSYPTMPNRHSLEPAGTDTTAYKFKRESSDPPNQQWAWYSNPITKVVYHYDSESSTWEEYTPAPPSSTVRSTYQMKALYSSIHVTPSNPDISNLVPTTVFYLGESDLFYSVPSSETFPPHLSGFTGHSYGT